MMMTNKPVEKLDDEWWEENTARDNAKMLGLVSSRLVLADNQTSLPV
jgi:hypothetical protein